MHFMKSRSSESEPSLQETTAPVSVIGRLLRVALVVALIIVAALSSYEIISHAQASSSAIEDILKTYNLKNEGEKAVDQYAKKHPLLGFFLSSPIKHQLELSSKEESESELGRGLAKSFKTVRDEACVTAWWACFLINFSLFAVALGVALDRSFKSRLVILLLTLASLSCFIIGVLAPVMVIWTAPAIPMETGTFSYVVQYEIRGIAAIIYELFTSGHWAIGGFLLLFSIITPLTKASLTIFATVSYSDSRNYKIGQFLHTIGKWSMADVFVAGILLSLFALKFQEATKSIACIGLYYFIGYCVVSMITTELLVRSRLVAKPEGNHPDGRVGIGVIIGLFLILFGFAAGSSFYTYEEYTIPTHERVQAPSSPLELNSANLALPAHKIPTKN